MILADKIIELRKRNGWSQEELAEQLNVTRQSVSKWEGAQSAPDLDKILQLSRMFGVSTDYLLKDELEVGEQTGETAPDSPARRVSLAEASEFLALKQATAGWIAFAVFLCVLSPVPLLFLGAVSEYGRVSLGENAAGGLGMVILLFMVAGAVAVFLLCGSKTERFAYLDKELIDTEYGVTGLAREWQRRLRPSRTVCNTAGTCLCVLAVVPLFAAMALTENEFLWALSVCALLLLVGVGVTLFVWVGIPWESTEKLLQEGDYTRQRKLRGNLKGAVATVYWLVVVAVYLLVSMRSGNWDSAGVIFAVAGVLFAALMVLWNAVADRREKPRP